jgi:hypothetical protein
MAIRFSCPSCQQPIEVDDDWGGQSVACPYCRRVVSAPAQSSWPPGDVPVASPAQTGFSPPPPPAGHQPVQQTYGGEYPPQMHPSPGKAGTATWALVLAISSGVLSFIGTMIWTVGLYELAMRQVGEDASSEQVQRAAQEIMLSGQAPISPGAVAALLVGIFCGVAALVLAIRSLVRNENQYVKAGTACLLAALFIVCQGMLMLALFMPRAAPA